MAKPIAGNIATKFQADMGQDVSGASAYELRWQDPDGVELIKTATLLGDDRTIQWIDLSGEIDTGADWKCHPYLDDWGGFTGYCKLVGFEVLKKFQSS